MINDELVTTGAMTILEFGIVGVVMLFQIGFIFYLHKTHGIERKDWRNLIIEQNKATTVIFDKQQDELLGIMKEVSTGLHEINTSIVRLENTIRGDLLRAVNN